MNNKKSAHGRGYFSPAFRAGLKPGGIQRTVIDVAANDPDLDIQLRDNYIDIYYKGGKILGIGPKSWTFDKFYFYLPAVFGDDYIGKTYLVRIVNGKLSDNNMSAARARYIISTLKEKSNQLTEMLPEKPDEYFDKAKKIMDAWFAYNSNDERADQQKITSRNKTADTETSLAVIDIEYAVSVLKEYNNSQNRIGSTKVCRFDMIAVDRNGQVYVIELKQNPGAEKSSTSDMKSHLADFQMTVSEESDRNRSFVREMKNLLTVKQELGIVSADLRVDTSKAPVFVAVYSGEDGNKKERILSEWRGLGVRILHYHDHKISL